MCWLQVVPVDLYEVLCPVYNINFPSQVIVDRVRSFPWWVESGVDPFNGFGQRMFFAEDEFPWLETWGYVSIGCVRFLILLLMGGCLLDAFLSCRDLSRTGYLPLSRSLDRLPEQYFTGSASRGSISSGAKAEQNLC